MRNVREVEQTDNRVKVEEIKSEVEEIIKNMKKGRHQGKMASQMKHGYLGEKKQH